MDSLKFLLLPFQTHLIWSEERFHEFVSSHFQAFKLCPQITFVLANWKIWKILLEVLLISGIILNGMSSSNWHPPLNDLEKRKCFFVTGHREISWFSSSDSTWVCLDVEENQNWKLQPKAKQSQMMSQFVVKLPDPWDWKAGFFHETWKFGLKILRAHIFKKWEVKFVEKGGWENFRWPGGHIVALF